MNVVKLILKINYIGWINSLRLYPIVQILKLQYLVGHSVDHAQLLRPQVKKKSLLLQIHY